MATEPHEQDLEFAAQIAALRFLLEQAYANSFAGNAPGFEAFMKGLMTMSATKGTVLQATPDEALELKARTAVHLERFGRSVMKRIQQSG